MFGKSLGLFIYLGVLGAKGGAGNTALAAISELKKLVNHPCLLKDETIKEMAPDLSKEEITALK